MKYFPQKITNFLYLKDLIEKGQQAGMKVDTVSGDTAYSEKTNIEYTKEEKIVSKLNPVISEGNRKEEDKFEYNMEIQCATTIFAVNLKRILKLMNEKE